MPHRIAGWFLALSAAWLADGVVSLVTRAGAGGVPGASEQLALAGPLYFGWVSVLLAVPAGVLHGLARSALLRLAPALGFDPASFASRALGVCLVALWGGGAYAASLYAATAFFNHKLASLLVTVGLGAVALGLVSLAPVAARAVAALTRDRAASLAVGSVFWSGSVAVASYLLWDNRKGFEQLPMGVNASAVTLLVAAPVLLRLARAALARVRPVNVYGMLGCFAMASVVVSGEWHTYAARVEGEIGASARMLSVLRRATDFDRDGSSSWFGGGDCAPYDRSVHPMAIEIIGDGIDNNCLGGDRTEPVESPPPRWSGPLDETGKLHNLVILTIDTVRPDHLPMFGYKRETTPHLQKHAKRSVLFERTYTGAPLTRLAMTSFFSSRRASEVRWTGTERRAPLPRIDRDQPWLPRILQEKGFRTAAFVPRFSQFERRGHGFDYGFTRYDYTSPMTHDGGSMQGFPAESQIDKAIRWLDAHHQGRFFVWVHLVEPHFEYQRHPLAPDFGDEPEDLYDSELWYADAEAGRLLEHLREKGHFDDTVILVAGDHGESFLEHGKQYHGFELYEPGIRTLGMLSAPGLEPGRVQAPISLLDFTPTLLNLLDVNERYDELRGQNLLPVLDDEARAREQVIVELFRLPLEGYEIAVVEERYKLYYVAASNRVLMFDLQEDPRELQPLHASHPEYGRLLDHLTAVFETARSNQQEDGAKDAEPAAKKDSRAKAGEAPPAEPKSRTDAGALPTTKKGESKKVKAAPNRPLRRPGAAPAAAATPRPTRGPKPSIPRHPPGERVYDGGQP